MKVINGYNDPVGEEAVALADKGRIRKSVKGIEMCRKHGCKRLVRNECYGWTDPAYWWNESGICPFYSGDPELIKKINLAEQLYERDQ